MSNLYSSLPANHKPLRYAHLGYATLFPTGAPTGTAPTTRSERA